MAIGREAFDEAVSNMTIRSTPFYQEYLYYLHMVSQCKVIFTTQFPAAAGVSFFKDHYVLYLNPSEVIAEGIDQNTGEAVTVLGFTPKMPLEQRIGILKHEMLHICNGHLLRLEERDPSKFNIATDCAINQEINRKHLPEYAIYPDTLPVPNAPLMQAAETYYDLLPDDEEQKNNGQGQGQENGQGNSQSNSGQQQVNGNSHDSWAQSEGNAELQKELTKNMVERAGKETTKSKGILPSEYSKWMENLSINREVNWKQVLRKIVGNKRAFSRKTLLRRDRRMPKANWLKGKTKDRVFNLAVISDVSGSVGEDALYKLWGEIISICETFNTPVTMVQVDTEASEPQELTRKTKKMERTRSGGTMLSPAIDKLRENKISFDALVVTTDGYLFNEDIIPFKDTRVPVVWLIEPQGEIMDAMNDGIMRAIKLKE